MELDAQQEPRPVTDEAVREELHTVLASPFFAEADRMSRFLRFVVETRLSGRAGELKESMIGVAVFDRDPSYDPKADAIVRVEARRLRARLLEYATAHPEARIRFELPKGSYVPQFTVVEAAETPPPDAPDEAPPRRVAAWMWAAPLACLAAAAGWLARPSPVVREPVARFSLALPPDQQLDPAGPKALALSPDGRELFYVARRQGRTAVFHRPLDSWESQPVSGTEDALFPVMNPSGDTLAFFTGTSAAAGYELKTVRLGSAPVRRARLQPQWEHLSLVWDGDGGLIYTDLDAHKKVMLYRAPANGAAAVPLQTATANLEVLFAQQFLSRSRELLFTRTSTPRDRSLRELTLSSAEIRTIQSPAMGGWLLPGGRLITFWDGALQVSRWDGRGAATSPVAVIRDVSESGWGTAQADVSSTGTLVYLAARVNLDKQLVLLGPGQQKTVLPGATGPYQIEDVTADGSRILVARAETDRQAGLWELDIRTGHWQRFLETNSNRLTARWSPDGSSIVIGLDRQGSDFESLYRFPVSHPEALERLTSGAGISQRPQSWRGDDIVFAQGNDPITKIDLYAYSLTDRKTRPLVVRPGRQTEGVVSPDGHWLAYASDEDGNWRVMVQAYPPNGADAVAVSPVGGHTPIWSSDSRAVRYYLPADGVHEVEWRGGRPGADRLLRAGALDWKLDGWGRTGAILPDGRVLATETIGTPPPAEIRVILHWTSELERLSAH
jgi:Tol biopolymer transport system component